MSAPGAERPLLGVAPDTPGMLQNGTSPVGAGDLAPLTSSGPPEWITSLSCGRIQRRPRHADLSPTSPHIILGINLQEQGTSPLRRAVAGSSRIPGAAAVAAYTPFAASWHSSCMFPCIGSEWPGNRRGTKPARRANAGRRKPTAPERPGLDSTDDLHQSWRRRHQLQRGPGLSGVPDGSFTPVPGSMREGIAPMTQIGMICVRPRA